VNSVPSQPVAAPAAKRQTLLWGVIAMLLLAAAAIAWKLWPAPASAPRADAVVDLSPEALDARLLQAENSLGTLHRTQET
jgi:uroporphyrin-3 C-methyltransferase